LNKVWNFPRIEVMNQCTTASNSQPGWIPAGAQQHNKFINQIQTMQNTTLRQHNQNIVIKFLSTVIYTKKTKKIEEISGNKNYHPTITSLGFIF
jgi:hypothetical protein